MNFFSVNRNVFLHNVKRTYLPVIGNNELDSSAIVIYLMFVPKRARFLIFSPSQWHTTMIKAVERIKVLKARLDKLISRGPKFDCFAQPLISW